jgi:hypothetical protein
MVSPFDLRSSGRTVTISKDYWSKVNIESIVNRNNNGWVLTLINNDGISKEFNKTVQIDPNQHKLVTINLNSLLLSETLPGKSLTKVTNWVTDQILWEKNITSGISAFSNLELDLAPGAIEVLEFQFN